MVSGRAISVGTQVVPSQRRRTSHIYAEAPARRIGAQESVHQTPVQAAKAGDEVTMATGAFPPMAKHHGANGQYWGPATRQQ